MQSFEALDLDCLKGCLSLGGSGFPLRFAGRAEKVLQNLAARKLPVHEESSQLTWNQLGHVERTQRVAVNAQPDDWMIIECWDTS